MIDVFGSSVSGEHEPAKRCTFPEGTFDDDHVHTCHGSVLGRIDIIRRDDIGTRYVYKKPIDYIYFNNNSLYQNERVLGLVYFRNRHFRDARFKLKTRFACTILSGTWKMYCRY